jgi:small-conductance mechanosensitive channel
MKPFLRSFDLSLQGLIDYLPALIGGIVVFLAGLFLSGFIAKIVTRYAERRSGDGLIASFLGKVVWAIIFILTTVLTLGILGLGTISNKILAGAGITTFIVGFALKDIGENFLSGVIIAFGRPFSVGSLIECGGVKGVVRSMTMRQTTVESVDGKIVLIPNSMIIKNPLSKYTSQDKLSQDFTIAVSSADARKAIDIISAVISGYDPVLHNNEKKVRVLADSVSADKVKIAASFWFDTNKIQGSGESIKSAIILDVIEKLRASDIDFSS